MVYEIEYSKRRKTVGILVERDRRVIVKAPEGFPASRIQEIVEKKKDWIEEKVNNSYKYPTQPSKKEFVSGESMMLMGRNCTLLVINENIRGIKFDGFSFRISKNNQERAHNLFVSWYKKYALSQIEPMAKSFAQRLGVTYNGCSVTDTMKYRWASCTPKGNVNFSWRIIKAPVFVIEYLIVHELAHLRISEHSLEFWNIVSIQVPSYEDAKIWLRDNGNVLEVDF